MSQDLLGEFRELVRATQAYVENHAEAGGSGFPKGTKWVAPSAAAGTLVSTEPASAGAENVQHARLPKAAATSLAQAAEPRPRRQPNAPTPPPEARTNLPDFVPPPELAEPRASTVGAAHTPLVASAKPREIELPDAERRAQAYLQLPILAERAATCERCNLHAHRKQSVFARGNPAAQLCFLGDAPSTEDEAAARPFSGLAGQLLDRMIFAMGLDPETQVYICHLVKCSPLDANPPSDAAVAACAEILSEQLAWNAPRVIVTLGNQATASLLGNAVGLARLRGQWKLHRGRTLVMPTHHPADLARSGPDQAAYKKETWQDLQLVMKELGLGAPRKRS